MAKKLSKKVIAIVGPTGSGKTSYALNFCNPQKHEIINGDSMQVYRQLSIGNNRGELFPISQLDKASISDQELSFNPVYLSSKNKVISWAFNIVDVTEEFSVADYQQLVRDVIKNVHKRDKIPVIVGGSGLYIYAALYGVDLQSDTEETQMQLEKKKSFGDDVTELQERLVGEGFDLEALNNSDRNNPRRLQNYLYKVLFGESGSEINTIQDLEKRDPVYDIDLKVMEVEMSKLECRLKSRVDRMIEEGFLGECKELLQIDNEVGLSDQIKTASGYKEVFEYLGLDEEDRDLRALKKDIFRSHRRLAKKQEKWNRKFFYEKEY